MASSRLYTSNPPVVVSSGNAIQPTITQLQTKETTSANARLFSVSAGTPSTIVNVNNIVIMGETVINDTPAPYVPSINIVLAYLYGGVVAPAGSKIKYWDGSQWQDINTMVVFQ